jgi:hypothetical protein
VLRSVVVLATLVVVAAAVAAGARPHPLLALGLLGLSVLTAVFPDSSAGLALLVGCGFLWTRVPASLDAWVLLAVAGMVAAHTSALVAGQGPPRLAVDPAQVRLWALRGLLVWLVAGGAWALARSAERGPEHRLVFAAGLALLVVLAVVAARELGARTRSS